VQLKTHIKICKQNEKGIWELIDEAGPSIVNFRANLTELSSGRRATTDFIWRTKTKKGLDYAVRLSGPANLSYNPVSGQLDGTFPFEITLNGKRALVNGRSTTESIGGPLGQSRGKRASGVLGLHQSEFTVVSVNDLQLPGEAPLKLVCLEEYRLVPQK
jgi:hypothetical protein